MKADEVFVKHFYEVSQDITCKYRMGSGWLDGILEKGIIVEALIHHYYALRNGKDGYTVITVTPKEDGSLPISRQRFYAILSDHDGKVNLEEVRNILDDVIRDD